MSADTARLFDLRTRFDPLGLVPAAGSEWRRVAEMITSAPTERSVEIADTLTLNLADPEWWLWRNTALIGRRRLRTGITTLVDGVSFTLSELEKTDVGEQLVFYDTAAAALKRFNGRDHPVKASRGAMTRAQFAERLCRRAGVPFFSPDKDLRQPIADLSDEALKALRAAARSQTASNDARTDRAKTAFRSAELTVKNEKASAEQRRNMRIILSVADREGGGPRARLALMVAAIGESSLRAVANSEGSGYAGVFQADPANIPQNDTEQQAYHFLRGGKGFQAGGAIAAAREHRDWSAGMIATKVEASGAPAEFYDRHREEALVILSAWSPGENVFEQRTGTPDRAFVERYEFEVARDEDYWDTLTRLAEEVAWRCYTLAGRVIFASDFTLIRARPLMVIREGENGIDSIRGLVTRGNRIDELSITCRLTAWAAPPGSAVLVENEGVASFDARGDLVPWLVRRGERDLLDSAGEATVTLGQPQAPHLEPASDVTTIQGEDAGGAVDGVAEDSHVGRAYAYAQRVDERNYPYVFGGGHNSAFKGPYDCSGFVSAVLHAGDLLDSPLSTGGLLSWGEPGEGKHMTVWVHETGDAHASHTFLTFKMPGAGREIFEAGGTHGAPTGRRQTRSFDGFSPRHWPGS